MLDDDTEIHPLFEGAPKTTEFKKLRKRLLRNTREAIEHYGMIEPGARWLVCLSGGKDSYTLLAVLYELKWRGLLPVGLIACNLDQGQPGFPATVLPEFLDACRCRIGLNTATPIPWSWTKHQPGAHFARYAPGCGAPTYTVSRARKDAPPWFWVTTAMIF